VASLRPVAREQSGRNRTQQIAQQRNRPRDSRALETESVTEAHLQTVIHDLLCVIGRRGWMWVSINNNPRNAVHGSKLKRMGCRAGFPDMLLIDPQGKHYQLELKTETGRASPAQLEWQAEMKARGVPCEIVKGWDEAYDVLTKWKVI
jgi:hypothetical protein